MRSCFFIGCLFFCLAGLSAADVSVTILAPESGQLVGDALEVEATIASTFEVAAAVAMVEDRSAPLTYGPENSWIVTLSLAGLARGEKTLVVTVTDVFGNVGQGTRSFVYDRPPSLDVVEPLDFSVARPQIWVEASCSDDDPAGCAAVKVEVVGRYDPCVDGGDLLRTTDGSPVASSVSLADYDGYQMRLNLVAFDSAGQETCVQREVYVESSTRLLPVESVPGRIFDFDAQRILFLEGSTLKIRDRATVLDTTVLDDPDHAPTLGYLTPTGAVFVDQPASVTGAWIYDWNEGQLLDVGPPNSVSSLRVRGDYGIWNDGILLHLRHFPTAQDDVIATDAGNWKNDLTPDGTVAYWNRDYQIFCVQGGISTQLTSDVDLWNVYPVTDGVNTVYKKIRDQVGADEYQVALHSPAGETLLTPATTKDVLSPPLGYAVSNGWVAFTREGSGGQWQVWLRSPGGVESQLTFWGDESRIDSLSSAGVVVVQHQKRLHLASPGAPALPETEIGSALGESVWVDATLYRVVGRTLFVLDLPFFEDGFESGDLTAWSGASP